MKIFKFAIMLLSIFATISCQSNGQSGKKGQQSGGELGLAMGEVLDMPRYDLSEDIREDLKYMWEEEKLARDVYITLSSHGKVFQNISKSEQKHMDAIALLLNKYNIAAIGSDTVGVFSTLAFQNLFNDLVRRGDESDYDAINVAIEIENLDINDLEERIIGVPDDIRLVYQKLITASYNHREAFERQ